MIDNKSAILLVCFALFGITFLSPSRISGSPWSSAKRLARNGRITAPGPPSVVPEWTAVFNEEYLLINVTATELPHLALQCDGFRRHSISIVTRIAAPTWDGISQLQTTMSPYLRSRAKYCQGGSICDFVVFRILIDNESTSHYAPDWSATHYRSTSPTENVLWFAKWKSVRAILPCYRWILFTDLDTAVVGTNTHLSTYLSDLHSNTKLMFVGQNHSSNANMGCLILKGGDSQVSRFLDEISAAEKEHWFQEDNGAAVCALHAWDRDGHFNVAKFLEIQRNAKPFPDPVQPRREHMGVAILPPGLMPETLFSSLGSPVLRFGDDTRMRPFCVRWNSSSEPQYTDGDFIVHGKVAEVENLLYQTLNQNVADEQAHRNSTASKPVALCVTGGVRSFATVPAIFEQMQNLSSLWGSDVFASLSCKDDVELATVQSQLSKWGAIRYQGDASVESTPSAIYTGCAEGQVPKQGMYLADSFYSQTTKWINCYEAIVEHERTRGVPYSWIIRMRPDTIFQSVQTNVLSLDDVSIHLNILQDGKCVSDQFAIIPRRHADVYMRANMLFNERNCQTKQDMLNVSRGWFGGWAMYNCTSFMRLNQQLPETDCPRYASSDVPDDFPPECFLGRWLASNNVPVKHGNFSFKLIRGMNPQSFKGGF